MDFNQIEQEAKKYFLDAKPSHDWDHTKRVYNLCIHIGEKENADLEILKLAAILHDIGRQHQDISNGNICHAEKGALLAAEILNKYTNDKEKINKIIHCIETHRFRKNKTPESKEAKILFDADKLDSIGAVGIGRAFSFSGEIGANIHNKEVDIKKTEEYSKDDTAFREFIVKLSQVKGRMLTMEGKKLAEQRHQFMIDFFNRLNQEVDGEL